MGVSIYRRPSDSALFAIVSRKEGPRQGYLWQYRLEDDGAGRVKATKVRGVRQLQRRRRNRSHRGGRRAWLRLLRRRRQRHSQMARRPRSPRRRSRVSAFRARGLSADREGIAIYAQPGDKGYIICTDQLPGGSHCHLFRREGSSTNPHDHSQRVRIIHGSADQTDGIEATSRTLGPRFPDGLMAAMNSRGRNFLFFDWREIMAPENRSKPQP